MSVGLAFVVGIGVSSLVIVASATLSVCGAIHRHREAVEHLIVLLREVHK